MKKKQAARKQPALPAAAATATKPSIVLPGLKLERILVAQLQPHPKNPRQHPAVDSPEWNTLVRSLTDDYFDPIVWNRRNGLLVSGHLRVKVLNQIGVEDVDCIVKDYDEGTHFAKMIQSNKHQGKTDSAVLAQLFGELKAMPGDLTSLTGFTTDDMARLDAQVKQMQDKDFLLNLASQPGINPGASPAPTLLVGPEGFAFVAALSAEEHAIAMEAIKKAKAGGTVTISEAFMRIIRAYLTP